MKQTDRLDSWKKIAAHFNRDVTTAQRWERREGMPVHRHVHGKQGSVYAYSAELDEWWQGRSSKLADLTNVAPAAILPSPRATRSLRWRLLLSVSAMALLVLGYAVHKRGSSAGETWRNPLADAKFTRLTDWADIEQAAEISRDGAWASFLSDHDGHMDAWLTKIGSGSYRRLTGSGRFELVNPSIRTLGFAADASLVTVWTRRSDGSQPDDIRLLAAPVGQGAIRDFLPGAAEVAWSYDGKRIAYHTTGPGDPIYVRDESGTARQIYVAPSGVHCHFPVWSKDDSFVYFAQGTPPGDWDIWRIRPSGGQPERVTFLDSRVSHPVFLDQRTLLYLADDSQGSGPWLFALDTEQRVPHRISWGLERYTSLAASADGTRLVATVDDSNSSLWRLPIGGRAADSPVSLDLATGRSPRWGSDYVLYVSARTGRQSIWKVANGKSRELWGDPHSTIVGAPAVSPDNRQIAFIVADGEGTVLYTMDSDGKQMRALTRSLQLRGSPAWAPDGRSIVSAVLRAGEPRLTNIFLDDQPPTPLVSEYSTDPVWSPDGQFLLYSGADVGTTFPLRAAARDGRPYAIPTLMLTRGARRVAFGPEPASIVLLRGDVGHKNFWVVDLHTGKERQISDLVPGFAITDFDVAPDGGAILFDHTQASSRVALIERGG